MKYIFNFRKKQYTCIGQRRNTYADDFETFDELVNWAAAVVGMGIHEVEFAYPNDRLTKKCAETIIKEAPSHRFPESYYDGLRQKGYKEEVGKAGMTWFRIE